MKKIITISTGIGRLHFDYTLDSLKKFSNTININLITGFVPKTTKNALIYKALGVIVRNSSFEFGLFKRISFNNNANKIFSCWLSEFVNLFLLLINKINLISYEKTNYLAWYLFRLQSKYFLKKPSNIHHIRSGAGVLKKSYRLKNNISLIVDHSIAHPNEVYNRLKYAAEFANISISKIDINPKSLLWDKVLYDCTQADILLVNSKYVLDSFVSNGFEENKIHIINLGVDKSIIGKKTIHSITDKMFLVFSGSFNLRKGCYIILNLIDMLEKIKINYQFDIIGSVSSKVKIPESILKNNNVKFHGHLDKNNLFSILINSDIYIFPSYSEGCAQSVKEAMGIGLPVITTYESGAPIINLYNGIIVDDNIPELYFDNIIKLYKDLKLREYLSANAIKTISDNHTWGQYSKELINLYNKF